MQKKHLIAYPATALIALGIGSAGGTDDSSVAAAEPAPTVTVSRPAEPKPGVTVTATPTVTVTKTPAAPAPETAMAGDGTYEVGIDIKPGTYVSTPADSGNCYWERSKGDGFDGILENDNTSGQAVVTIKKSDRFFKSSGCNDWTKR
jgi:hypothetical protein